MKNEERNEQKGKGLKTQGMKWRSQEEIWERKNKKVHYLRECKAIPLLAHGPLLGQQRPHQDPKVFLQANRCLQPENKQN